MKLYDDCTGLNGFDKKLVLYFCNLEKNCFLNYIIKRKWYGFFSVVDKMFIYFVIYHFKFQKYYLSGIIDDIFTYQS